MKSLENYPYKNIPSISSIITLIKPITWFPPMWAFLCGAVSSSNISFDTSILLLIGLILSGPIVCGMSQAINDWGDQEVDAINEPNRPIPSGRISSGRALFLALALSITGLTLGWSLGEWVFIATILAISCAWVYSVEPFRLKKSGVLGPAVVAFCYEGVPWFTGAAVMIQGFPKIEIIAIASLYAFGAFGIMTLNDFKALKGDTVKGINSLPVRLGPNMAAKIACFIMIIPQVTVFLMLYYYGILLESSLIAIVTISQIVLMTKLLRSPEKFAPWYNATGVTLYVSGMMLAAIALRSIN